MSYNGIGLQTTRGSGTNGYVQTNKFHRSASRLERKEWKDLKEIHGEGDRGGAKKPCEDILEHNRKREIERKLVELEDDLEERGIAREEIDEMLKDARAKYERESERKKGAGARRCARFEASPRPVPDLDQTQTPPRTNERTLTRTLTLTLTLTLTRRSQGRRDARDRGEEGGEDGVPPQGVRVQQGQGGE